MELRAPTTWNYENMYFPSDFTKIVFYKAVNLITFKKKHFEQLLLQSYSLQCKGIHSFFVLSARHKEVKYKCLRVGIAQSVQWLTTGWKVRGLNPGGGEIFHIRPDRPWGPPSLLYNGYQVSFQGVQRLGRGVDHTPPSSVEVKEIIAL